ncbi:unnamed protein product [Pleuronectes platessa]|uniref:Uncharacterized protein n=1 Tax=Pleuronectes platessa TaxID=8262 RepID=A0A9N7VI60_PLEPL|nr:unnamed protein product [Pleuronectes platessa]
MLKEDPLREPLSGGEGREGRAADRGRESGGEVESELQDGERREGRERKTERRGGRQQVLKCRIVFPPPSPPPSRLNLPTHPPSRQLMDKASVCLRHGGEEQVDHQSAESIRALAVDGSPLSDSSCLVGHSRRLKGTKLDHRDTRREPYPQHKWLSAGLIDKLPLHFISQTDRA